MCSEGTLLVRGTLKRSAFDLLEMPQVIAFLLKVVLQEKCGILSALGLVWETVGDFKEGAVVLLCCSCELLDCKHLFLNCIIRIS